MSFIPTPNVNERDPRIAVEYVVLHYTGMQDTAAALGRLCDPESNVSVHYLIDVKGTVLKMADESRRAWHAGESFWRGQKDMNSASIGIELVNPGHAHGYSPFPSEQMLALKTLLRSIVARHNLSPALALLGHSDIAPRRKQDPGELFPWEDFAREGFGLWPAPSPEDVAPMDAKEIAEKLSAIGYETDSLPDSLKAFQRRYNPGTLTGEADPQTAAKMRALLRALTAQRLKALEWPPARKAEGTPGRERREAKS